MIPEGTICDVLDCKTLATHVAASGNGYCEWHWKEGHRSALDLKPNATRPAQILDAAGANPEQPKRPELSSMLPSEALAVLVAQSLNHDNSTRVLAECATAHNILREVVAIIGERCAIGAHHWNSGTEVIKCAFCHVHKSTFDAELIKFVKLDAPSEHIADALPYATPIGMSYSASDAKVDEQGRAESIPGKPVYSWADVKRVPIDPTRQRMRGAVTDVDTLEFNGKKFYALPNGEPLELITTIPMILHCPACFARHIDEGEFATRDHHTHACQHCGFVWRPAIMPTQGVQFLPGFKS